ncbi:MAG TPA: potassium transporter Kup, partial [Acidimicrobiales bacterium]|nr:potassium transporter Kup [Acidimicrobiales bacterium]
MMADSTSAGEAGGRSGWSRSSRGSGLLALGALGVVYGDIGTSPLYAFRESLDGAGHELGVVPVNVLGILSLIFWALIVVISVKYLVFVMRADNGGEGGILALTALVAPPSSMVRGGRRGLVVLGLFGAALLYGDGMITPAISVLSAVEGTSIVTPALSSWVLPIAVVILVALFSIQRRGTAAVGAVFGPVMVVWFLTLGILGVLQIIDEPSVLRAVDPSHAWRFFAENRTESLFALGAVFLVVTGGEALYADMGHFGRRPIRLAWFGLVLPGLLLNYFGQGALLLGHPERIDNPFYRMAPTWGVLPLVVLSTAATVIASQALISGAFSLTVQAVQLGYIPRVRITHTSEVTVGQIYVPAINWSLMVGCIALVIGFGSASGLAAAYGVAVTSTMVLTTILLVVVLHERFGWRRRHAAILGTGFLVVDVGFLGANIVKIPAGGWFPLVVGAIVFTLMTTWRTGRRLVGERIRGANVPLATFVAGLASSPTPAQRVPGTAVFLYSTPGMTPPSLIANLRHNGVLHEQVVVVSIVTGDQPRVAPVRRAEVVDHDHGVSQVVLRYGFLDEPDIPRGLTEGAAKRLRIDSARATYFLGSESLVVTDRPGMAIWRERLFTVLSRNATGAANYFGLPTDR